MAEKTNPAFSQERLKKLLRAAQNKPVWFAFALDRKGDEHELLLHEKKSGQPLLKMLKDNRKHVDRSTWGTARLGSTVLRLDCEKELQGIGKGIRSWVRQAKLQTVKKAIALQDPDRLRGRCKRSCGLL